MDKQTQGNIVKGLLAVAAIWGGYELFFKKPNQVVTEGAKEKEQSTESNQEVYQGGGGGSVGSMGGYTTGVLQAAPVLVAAMPVANVPDSATVAPSTPTPVVPRTKRAPIASEIMLTSPVKPVVKSNTFTPKKSTLTALSSLAATMQTPKPTTSTTPGDEMPGTVTPRRGSSGFTGDWDLTIPFVDSPNVYSEW